MGKSQEFFDGNEGEGRWRWVMQIPIFLMGKVSFYPPGSLRIYDGENGTNLLPKMQ
jgi:hypothetical protein